MVDSASKFSNSSRCTMHAVVQPPRPRRTRAPASSSKRSVLWHEAKLLFARVADTFLPVVARRVCFVSRYNAPLAGNLRIMLDEATRCPELEIGFFREGPLPAETRSWLESHSVAVMERFSFRSLFFLLSSGTVVLSHSARDAYVIRRKQGRRVVQLWHGVALKRIEALMRPQRWSLADWHRRRLIRRNARLYDAVIASSEADRRVNAGAFGVPLDTVHATGLPRYAYLAPGYAWPTDLETQRSHLRQLVGPRRFVLYAPTFRDSGTGLPDLISPQDLAFLREFCQREQVVFGIRTHPYRSREPDAFCDGVDVVNVSPELFPEAAVLLAAADVLIVDYSSIWVDYLLRERAIIGYVPDWEKYTGEDRGFIHDLRKIFPGPLCRDWNEVLMALTNVLQKGTSPEQRQKQVEARQLLLPPREQVGEAVARCLALLPSSDPRAESKASRVHLCRSAGTGGGQDMKLPFKKGR